LLELFVVSALTYLPLLSSSFTLAVCLSNEVDRQTVKCLSVCSQLSQPPLSTVVTPAHRSSSAGAKKFIAVVAHTHKMTVTTQWDGDPPLGAGTTHLHERGERTHNEEARAVVGITQHTHTHTHTHTQVHRKQEK
jgi:hypothetical protein